jgi:hypothetical protein
MQVLVEPLLKAHPLHGHDRPGEIREDPGEERRDGRAHRVPDQDEVVAADGVGEVGHVVQVVEEVVVPAGPDPLRVAVSPEVRGDHVVARGGERRADGGEAPGAVEEAVQAEEGGAAAAVPLEQVVAEAVRRDLALRRTARLHGGAA